MQSVFKRLLMLGVGVTAALAVAAGPASAAATSGMSSTLDETASAPAGVSSPAVVDSPQSGDITGTAAASVGFRIFNANCFPNDVTFSARTFENGFSGVQRFQQRAQLQTFTARGWVNASGVATRTSVRFPNTGANRFYQVNWDGNHPNNGASWRVKWQGFYFNGAGQVIALTRVIFVTCF